MKMNNIINTIINISSSKDGFNKFDKSNEDRKNQISETKLKNFKIKILKELLYNIKITLLVNSKTLTLDDFSFSILNSSSLIKEAFLYQDKIQNLLVFLSNFFNDLYSIKYNHLIGYVVVLNNKNYVIPDNDELRQYFN